MKVFTDDKGKFLDDVVVNILANLAVLGITSLASTFLTVGSGLWIVISQTNAKEISLIGWGILFFSFLLGVCNLVLGLMCFIKRKNTPQFPELFSDVRYEKAITELYFKDRENISCSREVGFKVLCSDLNKITKRFSWSGSAYKSTYIEAADGNYTLEDSGRKQPPQAYDIVFDAVKKKGETGTYRTRTEVEDAKHVMSPHLSHQIRSQTDYLELRVTAPVGLIKDAKFVEYADNMGELPISKPVKLTGKIIGNLETFEKVIDEPRLLHVYRIEWKF